MCEKVVFLLGPGLGLGFMVNVLGLGFMAYS